jgi:hypothetical protein
VKRPGTPHYLWGEPTAESLCPNFPPMVWLLDGVTLHLAEKFAFARVLNRGNQMPAVLGCV